MKRSAPRTQRIHKLLLAMRQVDAALANLAKTIGTTDEPLRRETLAIQQAFTQRRLAINTLRS